MANAGATTDQKSIDSKWGPLEIIATVALGLLTLGFQIVVFFNQQDMQEKQTELASQQNTLASQQAELSRQVTASERYNQAADQLASEQPIERVAGIYGLRDLIAHEQETGPRALRLMASYLVSYDEGVESHERGVAAGALTAMSKIVDPNGENDPLAYDISNVNLSGLYLSGLRADGGFFAATNFEAAILSEAQLTCTDFRYANLSGADLSGAVLDKVLVNGQTDFTAVQGAGPETFQQLYWDQRPVGVTGDPAGSAADFQKIC